MGQKCSCSDLPRSSKRSQPRVSRMTGIRGWIQRRISLLPPPLSRKTAASDHLCLYGLQSPASAIEMPVADSKMYGCFGDFPSLVNHKKRAQILGSVAFETVRARSALGTVPRAGVDHEHNLISRRFLVKKGMKLIMQHHLTLPGLLAFTDDRLKVTALRCNQLLTSGVRYGSIQHEMLPQSYVCLLP